MNSWIPISPDSHFTIHNLPFGIFSAGRKKTRLGIAIGDQILDLAAVAELGFFDDLAAPRKVFDNDFLNDFIALGKPVTNAVRLRVQNLLSDENSPLKNHPEVFEKQSEAVMHLPVRVGDYTDFYSSIEHATNVGKMFRDPANALLPNWRHLPVGYHGRASSIVVSGTDIRRPSGQVLPTRPTAGREGADVPVFQKSARLDFELEMAFVIGKESPLGQPISTAEAEDHIFGMVIFNDWSARDIQQWEYVPLGPFLGKNFGSSVSPWVVTMEALEPFRVAGPEQQPAVLPYLSFSGNKNYDIALKVSITPPQNDSETVVSRSNFKFMYWNMCQQLAHHTVNGCNMRVGDLLASGTISGPTEDSFGSMLEISWMGTKPVTLADGTTRTFILDNDTVTMQAVAEKDGVRVGFGEVLGKILS